jgi:transcriptional adapter 2-alpha
LFPETYLAIRKLFVDECRKNNGLGKRAAREMVKMDVNKSSKVWEYLQMHGKVWVPFSRTAGDF